jgi:hypothetical protein
LRFFKLARYSPGIRSLVSVLEAERKALAASAIILCGAVLFAAAGMHLAEHEAQPDKFGSIPLAIWWAVETVTTVGYGDAVPVTLAGRIIAFREANGPFEKVDELAAVQGIGDKSLAKLRPYVATSGATSLSEKVRTPRPKKAATDE